LKLGAALLEKMVNKLYETMQIKFASSISNNLSLTTTQYVKRLATVFQSFAQRSAMERNQTAQISSSIFLNFWLL
jgi:hypothetical protein